ncbi:MAG: hypothetical protein HZB53_13765 [Chloroflexi bacterium]|nr:hypothetical protein [Chloroflexota bacterium]
MNTNEMPANDTAKKPYIAPQIVFKQRLEAMAIVCTNVTPPSKASVGAGCDGTQLFS